MFGLSKYPHSYALSVIDISNNTVCQMELPKSNRYKLTQSTFRQLKARYIVICNRNEGRVLKEGGENNE